VDCPGLRTVSCEGGLDPVGEATESPRLKRRAPVVSGGRYCLHLLGRGVGWFAIASDITEWGPVRSIVDSRAPDGLTLEETR
jgi:hypothetical protein